MGPVSTLDEADAAGLEAAYRQAREGFAEGGVPIGASLAEDGRVVATGRNLRVQEGDPTAHGEITCLRHAGRRTGYRSTTLYTTLAPCAMCAGAIVQFRIPRVVIGEATTFGGHLDLLRAHGTEVLVADDPRCRDLMAEFQRRSPRVWAEDIGD
ncbi:nucleoside deaminase [Saccharomonospora iraqiensis]|uniref:nucleoside deaminase n=1 Tax=Saccharomonospora iraqiensis TaxID=52698 RepID=UPI0004192C3B|nr:nucleoside deaminase [Saccharomonospora iraqiensis]